MNLENIIFLEPIFKEMLWGGNLIKERFYKNIKGNNIGEAWCISANKNGDCKIINTKHKGKTLSEFWDIDRGFFGNYESETFPLLSKVIDAKKDLSIQVHPNDEYANQYEKGSLGKNEAWLVLDCNKDSNIIIGHNAKDKSELKNMIQSSKWKELIKEIPINKGDFFQIDAGDLHAIKANTLIFEIQQNSDITFRVYDYDRLYNGKKRELHIDESIDCIEAPFINKKVDISLELKDYGKKIEYISNKYYCIKRYIINTNMKFINKNPFSCFFILEGKGGIDDILVKKGDSFIISSRTKEFEINGKLDLIEFSPI